MIRTLALASFLFATAACAQPAAAPPGPPPPVLIPESVPASTTPPVQPPLTAAHCEASELAWLIGKPRSEIPVPVDPSHRRVYCSTCMVTQDYWPDRTNIVYDSRTGVILSVKCG